MSQNPFLEFQGVVQISICEAHLKGLSQRKSIDGRPSRTKILCRILSQDPELLAHRLATHIVSGSDSVTWDDSFEVAVDVARFSEIRFSVQEVSHPNPETLGEYHLNLSALPTDKTVDQWLDLDNNAGQIRLRLLFNPMKITSDIKQTRTRKLTHLLINLEKDEVMAHEEVVGTVVLNVSTPMKIQSPLEILFRGYVRISHSTPPIICESHAEIVRWHEGEGAEKKTHSSNSLIYEHEIVLEQTRNTEILPGENKFAFKIPLPSVMPPSAVTNFGKIEYYVEASLPGHYSERKYVTIWVPVRVADKAKGRANEVSLTRHNVKLTAWTQERLLFVHEQPLVVNLRLEIDNSSKRALHRMEILFVRRSKFRAADGALISKPVVLFSKTVDEVVPARSFISQEYMIDLPEGYRQQSITSDIGAKLITIKHWIVISLRKDIKLGGDKKISVEIPIFIGEAKSNHAKTKQLEHGATVFRSEGDEMDPKLASSLDKVHM